MLNRKYILASLTFFCLALGVLTACDSSPTGGGGELTLEQKIALTPRANAEAENMALFLSGELVTSEELYRELLADVSKFREQNREALPLVDSIGFGPFKQTDHISVQLTDSAMTELIAANYFGLDSLNSLFKAAPVDTTGLHDSTSWLRFSKFLSIDFNGRYNPDSLVVRYSEVPGVRLAEASSLIGVGSILLPWEVDGNRVFLLYKGGGCNPVCVIRNHFYYFIKNRSTFDLVADWGTNGTVIPAELAPIVEEMFQTYRDGWDR